jgi:hypothetical protein
MLLCSAGLTMNRSAGVRAGLRRAKAQSRRGRRRSVRFRVQCAKFHLGEISPWSLHSERQSDTHQPALRLNPACHRTRAGHLVEVPVRNTIVLAFHRWLSRGNAISHSLHHPLLRDLLAGAVTLQKTLVKID